MTACRHPCHEDDGLPFCSVCARLDALADAPASMPEPTHDEGDHIACPWCARPHRDLWDHVWDSSECAEVECDCGRSFTLIRSVSVSYEARPVRPRDTEPGPTEALESLPPCSAPGCEGRCGECFRIPDVPRCHYCERPKADPMVVANDRVPSLAGKRFHASCFREALERAVLELERRGVLTVDRGEVDRG